MEPDRAGKDVPAAPQVDKSGLPETWFGYLWKIEPKLFLASAFMQLSWSSCAILAAYYFVNQMTANKDQQRGLELCFGYLGTIISIAVSHQLKNLWGWSNGRHHQVALVCTCGRARLTSWLYNRCRQIACTRACVPRRTQHLRRCKMRVATASRHRRRHRHCCTCHLRFRFNFRRNRCRPPHCRLHCAVFHVFKNDIIEA